MQDHLVSMVTHFRRPVCAGIFPDTRKWKEVERTRLVQLVSCSTTSCSVLVLFGRVCHYLQKNDEVMTNNCSSPPTSLPPDTLTKSIWPWMCCFSHVLLGCRMTVTKTIKIWMRWPSSDSTLTLEFVRLWSLWRVVEGDELYSCHYMHMQLKSLSDYTESFKLRNFSFCFWLLRTASQHYLTRRTNLSITNCTSVQYCGKKPQT